MDIVLKTENGRFNYRACAVIIKDGKILAMTDENAPYYYLIGGKVGLHETAENAVLREIKEETGVNAEIIRPLWVCQNFFTECVTNDKYHELCFYFLVDISETDILQWGDKFTVTEGKHTLNFEWLKTEELDSKYLVPEFLKRELKSLPENLKMITVIE